MPLRVLSGQRHYVFGFVRLSGRAFVHGRAETFSDFYLSLPHITVDPLKNAYLQGVPIPFP